MIAIGADPGLSGAIACACTQRGLLAWSDLPTTDAGAGPKAKIRNQLDARMLRRLVAGWSIRFDFTEAARVVGVIERMTSFGGKDVVPAGVLLSMGHGAGIIEGTLAAYTHEFLRPLPQQWKKQFALKSDKRASVIEAQRRFPQLGRCRADVAEAVLLAVWGTGAISLPAPDLGPDPMAMPATARIPAPRETVG